MKTDVFQLQIVPVGNILPHEDFDNSRTKPLCESIKKDGYIANPVIVAPIGKEKYLELDGMNRLASFQYMGLPSIITQIIDYNDQENVELSSWTHLFCCEKKDFLDYLSKTEGLLVKEGRIENIGYRYIKEEGLGRLCTLVCRDKSVYLISTNGKLTQKIKMLDKVVNYYRKKIVRDVLPTVSAYSNIDILFKEHTDCQLMVAFPTFTRHQIVEVVKNGQLFPPGITRHIIKRRCLNLNLPLSMFEKKYSLAQQNKRLEDLLLRRKFRVYEEPTIYFE